MTVGELTLGRGAAAPGRIFISYRREETAYPAGWLFDRLADRFGEAQIFKDIDSIEPGDDFVETITHAVGSCDVLLALIGHEWLTTADTGGHRRIDDPNDFLRLEIEAALSRNVRVIPILVEGARMPRADELPASLAGLVRRQALELSPTRFASDLGRLLTVLDRILGGFPEVPAAGGDPPGEPDRPPPRRGAPLGGVGLRLFARLRRLVSTPARAVAVVAAVILLCVVVFLATRHQSPPSSGDDSTPSEEPAPSADSPTEGAWAGESTFLASRPVVVVYRDR